MAEATAPQLTVTTRVEASRLFSDTDTPVGLPGWPSTAGTDPVVVAGGGTAVVVTPVGLLPRVPVGTSSGRGGGGLGTDGIGCRSGSVTASSGLRMVTERVVPSASTITPWDAPGVLMNSLPSSKTSSGSPVPAVITSSPERFPEPSSTTTFPAPRHGT